MSPRHERGARTPARRAMEAAPQGVYSFRTPSMDEFGINSGYVAEQLDRWLHNPESVDENWRRYFQNRLNGHAAGPTNGHGVANGTTSERSANGLTAAMNRYAVPTPMSMVEGQGHVAQLINAYRDR